MFVVPPSNAYEQNAPQNQNPEYVSTRVPTQYEVSGTYKRTSWELSVCKCVDWGDVYMMHFSVSNQENDTIQTKFEFDLTKQELLKWISILQQLTKFERTGSFDRISADALFCFVDSTSLMAFRPCSWKIGFQTPVTCDRHGGFVAQCYLKFDASDCVAMLEHMMVPMLSFLLSLTQRQQEKDLAKPLRHKRTRSVSPKREVIAEEKKDVAFWSTAEMLWCNWTGISEDQMTQSCLDYVLSCCALTDIFRPLQTDPKIVVKFLLALEHILQPAWCARVTTSITHLVLYKLRCNLDYCHLLLHPEVDLQDTPFAVLSPATWKTRIVTIRTILECAMRSL